MKVLHTLQAILREIFEESAYRRFCEQQGMTVGRESYAQFLRDGATRKTVKVRCC